MTQNHEHAALAVAYELQPGTWAFTLENGEGAQLAYSEFPADGPFHGDVIAIMLNNFLLPAGLVVDRAEAWTDHDGRWSAIVDKKA